jgi:glycine hydroxymethyltransferase
MKKDLELSVLHEKDPEVASINDAEELRQFETLAFIPSENYASPAVREASATVLTNKYSEGYPGARYYPGNEQIDKVETLAQQRALVLFGLSDTEWGVNVQPHSGSPANLAIYKAILKKDDVALGMALSHGGHLTHGYKASASGTFFHFEQYGLNDEERIDFDQVQALANEFKPKLIVCGATAYPRTIDFARFSEIAKSVGAYLMADVSHIAGLIAGGAHPSPFPYADIVMTTTHKSLRGPRGAMIFARAELMKEMNKAIIPGLQGGPHNNTTAAIAVALGEAGQREFKEYAEQIVKNAKVLTDALAQKGHRVVSGGTDNHLFLLDFRESGYSGSEAEIRLESIGITANRNTVPNDPRTPFDPSGVRFGTPAVTTRGMKEAEMEIIADCIDKALKQEDVESARKTIRDLARKFPPPGFGV